MARGRSRAGPRGDLVWLLDWMVGRVMEALKSIDALDSTAVVVTSDNGALPGDRVMAPDGRESYRTWGHRSCGDRRGYKARIWEGGHREPLVVSWPGVVEPGATCAKLVCLNDLLATAAEMAEAPVPEGAAEDSVSLLPLLEGRRPSAPGRAPGLPVSSTDSIRTRRRRATSSRVSPAWCESSPTSLPLVAPRRRRVDGVLSVRWDRLLDHCGPRCEDAGTEEHHGCGCRAHAEASRDRGR